MPIRTDAVRRGFTLIEGLVTLLIVTAMLIALLTLLDSSNRLAKQETQVSDAQGSGRSAIYEITRLVRQARTGSLSPANAVMPWVNNATTETITAGSVSHRLRPGTDAIELRGVFFGETYYLGVDDVACGTCTGTGSATVTIPQVSLERGGYTNFPAGGRPELAGRTEPFYFVVSSTNMQEVIGTDSSGAGSYQVPLYYVGRVNANASGSWFTYNGSATPATFTFTVNFGDAGAQALNASSATTPGLNEGSGSIYAGGVVDRLVLFVDRGPQDPAGLGGGFTHPYLAQAVSLADGTWTVQRLIDDVEDLQFAYGVDGADGSIPDRGIDPTALSTTPNGDEWVFNVAGEALTVQASPRRIDAFLGGPRSALPGATATPALRAVYVAIVVKSLESDVRFVGPGARGVKVLDSIALPVSAQPYRRRVQTMAVNLRNYV